jgi:hypothetical protein
MDVGRPHVQIIGGPFDIRDRCGNAAMRDNAFSGYGNISQQIDDALQPLRDMATRTAVQGQATHCGIDLVLRESLHQWCELLNRLQGKMGL